jgi:hypothetical protein
LSEYTEDEIQALKDQEKKRKTKQLVVNQEDFEAIAKPGRRINMGEVRKDSPALDWFKAMTGKTPDGKGMLKYTLPDGVREQVLQKTCPDCGGPLDTTDRKRIFNCSKCKQDFAMNI